jgi:GAF domain-containing protein
MAPDANRPLHTIGPDEVLRLIAEGTASATGEQFFRILTRTLGEVLGTYGAWVTEYLEDQRALRGIAFWMNGDYIENYFTYIDNTPCEVVVTEKRLVHYPDRLVELFDVDPDVIETGAVSYMGVPLLDKQENLMGHLAVIDRSPMQADPRMVDMFRIFAARAVHQAGAREERPPIMVN